VSFDQSLAQPAAAAQPGFQAGHAAPVALVIIAKKVQQPVQGQHPKLVLEGMTGLFRLTARHTRRNHHVAEIGRFFRRPASPKPTRLRR